MCLTSYMQSAYDDAKPQPTTPTGSRITSQPISRGVNSTGLKAFALTSIQKLIFDSL